MSMGFSRQEYWSGVPLPSPQNENNISLILDTPILWPPPKGFCLLPWPRCFQSYIPAPTRWDSDVFLKKKEKKIIQYSGWLLAYGEGEVAQSCPTLCDPVDGNLLGFSIHGIFQARILEWIAISFSRRSSQPRDQTQVSRIGGRRFNLWSTREAAILTTRHITGSVAGTVTFWDCDTVFVG